MNIISFKRKLTTKDIEEINTKSPETIEITNINLISKKQLDKINDRIKIKVGKDVLKNEINTEYEKNTLKEYFTNIDSIVKGVDSGWSDAEKALYVYVNLIKEFKYEKGKNYNYIDATINKSVDRKNMAMIYQEILKKLKVNSKIYSDKEGNSWNEVDFGEGKYYPLDIAGDAEKYKNDGTITIIQNKNFYDGRNHVMSDKYKGEPNHEIHFMDQDKLLEILNKVEPGQYKVSEPIVEIHSKELTKIFTEGKITSKNHRKIRIEVESDISNDFKEDLKNIINVYPNIIDDFEIDLSKASKDNAQNAVDIILDAQNKVTTKADRKVNTKLTIIGDKTENFDIDFLNSSNTNGNKINFKDKTIKFVGKGTKPVKLPDLTTKIPKELSTLEVENVDFINAAIGLQTSTKLKLIGGNTVNISSLKDLEKIGQIAVDGISDKEFDELVNNILPKNPNLFNLEIYNQNCASKNILKTLSRNVNLVGLTLEKSSLDNLNGLDDFQGRLYQLSLEENNFSDKDSEKIEEFIKNNIKTHVQWTDSGLQKTLTTDIKNISVDTQEYIRKRMAESGMITNLSSGSKGFEECLERIRNTDMQDIPYYIEDAEIFRDKLKMTRNPIMIKDGQSLSNIDFSKPYLQDATILLSTKQIDELIKLKKQIPQNIRCKISSSNDLTNAEMQSLRRKLKYRNMTLTGVEILDDKNDNTQTQIKSYTPGEYNKISKKVEELTADVDMSLPQIERFAIVYNRLMKEIEYDHDAVNSNTRSQFIKKQNLIYSSRNLLNGLDKGKCVCAGYSDILRNALEAVGIESRLICGKGTIGAKTGHAWNEVCMEDANGNKAWYGTDLTWDSGADKLKYTLLGEPNFTQNGVKHGDIKTQNIPQMSKKDFDRNLLKDAFAKAEKYEKSLQVIDIPQDPKSKVPLVDIQDIKDEYRTLNDDMLAKYYGNKEYRKRYLESSKRYKSNEVEVVSNGIKYKTIRDYPERKMDEQILILDNYKDSLERVTRYEAGDKTVYTGTPDEIKEKLEKDKEYINTRNFTFNQNENTVKDLTTLGKYGQKMAYRPKEKGIIRNTARLGINTLIGLRNGMSYIYKGIGTHVVSPISSQFRKNDATPYRNNPYHRMVARREYFEEVNSVKHPNQNFINIIRSRVQAITNAKEGNKATINAKKREIFDNVTEKKKKELLTNTYKQDIDAYDQQIRDLENSLKTSKRVKNQNDVIKAIQSKKRKKKNLEDKYNKALGIEVITEQTDPVNARQHDIASQEVNTAKVTIAKAATIAACKVLIPKAISHIGMHYEEIENTVKTKEAVNEWIPPTYKEVEVAVPGKLEPGELTVGDIVSNNNGKVVTASYSVYGGENGNIPITIGEGDHITGIYHQVESLRGTGFSDTVKPFTAPKFTDKTFAEHLLDSEGFLKKDTDLNELIDQFKLGKITKGEIEDMYVAVENKGWVKLSELVELKDKTGIEKVIDKEGHYETIYREVEKVVKDKIPVFDKTWKKVSSIVSKAINGVAGLSAARDVVENVRTTQSEEKPLKSENKKRDYRFNDAGLAGDMPLNRKDYKDYTR